MKKVEQQDGLVKAPAKTVVVGDIYVTAWNTALDVRKITTAKVSGRICFETMCGPLFYDPEELLWISQRDGRVGLYTCEHCGDAIFHDLESRTWSSARDETYDEMFDHEHFPLADV